MSLDLDDIDRAGLRELARDARQPASALGRKLGLSQPAAWRRIKRLEDANVISGRRVRLDEAGRELAAELGNTAAYMHLDVTRKADWDHAVDAAGKLGDSDF